MIELKRLILISLSLVALTAFGLIAGGSLPTFFLNGSPLTVDGTASVVTKNPIQSDWKHYGSDPGGSRFASHTQISRETVQSLEAAWTYSTGDMQRGDLMYITASEATPILIDDKLIFCTPFNEIIALDPGSGEEVWRFNPNAPTDQYPANLHVCRGVTHFEDERAASCQSRIFMGTNNGLLVAVDAETGGLCEEFGDNGIVTLEVGKDLLWPGEFHVTSPPVVARQTVIVGSSISDNERVDAPVGAVRAFDAISGAPKWLFDPIPREPGAGAAEDWASKFPPDEGGANVWAPMSVDLERGLVFLPTSSASPDFYGGLRPGDNRHANSVVALNFETGEIAWSFQLIHHDIWDYDVPAQPGLYQVTTDEGVSDVVAQVTKTGHVFVLDRDTGAPFLPIEERPVPQRAASGEALSETQPFPVRPDAIVPNKLNPEDAFGITWIDRQECKRKIEGLWSGGLFAAPTEEGTVLYPFAGGGANWGGSAYDAARNLLVVNMSNLAHVIHLIPAGTAAVVEEANPYLEVGRQTGARFAVTRDVLLSSFGLPCSPPPYGVIAGIDLARGEIVWRKTLGTSEEALGGIGLALGTPNFGGPIITDGGVVFVGATMDNYLRAFDVDTGQELWKGKLPAGAQATPMTYMWEGRQYVVIYAGGHARVGTTLGDQVIAFALPTESD